MGRVGSCGGVLCCSTWLTDFRSVNTSAARYQQLSLNPQKLAGQCGKLKCCLNYELDTYLDALKGLPDMDTKLYTEKGDAICQKVDIFKGLMWFAYTDNMAHWHVLNAEQVKEMIAVNKQKERVTSLEDYAIEEAAPEVEKTFQNAMGQDSLTRFDTPKRKKRPNNKKKKASDDRVPADRPAGDRPQRDRNTNDRKPQGERSQGQSDKRPQDNRNPNDRGPKDRNVNKGPRNNNRNNDRNNNRNANRNGNKGNSNPQNPADPK